MENKTAIIQIGNSDGKLIQQTYSMFILEIHQYFEQTRTQLHFSGGSSPEKKWQNYCFVFEYDDRKHRELNDVLSFLCERYGQDSIALTIGETRFVQAKKELLKIEVKDEQ